MKSLPIVLLIDDDSEMLAFMRGCIAGLNCNIIEACNANEAMMIMNSLPVDVVITDFNMPVTTGLELTKMIRVINAEVPIVLCSSHLLIDEDDMRRAGVTQHIPKDIEHIEALRNFVTERIGLWRPPALKVARL